MNKLLVFIGIILAVNAAKSPSPSRTPSVSVTPSVAPTCAGSGNCAIFYPVEDSYIMNIAADSCNTGLGSRNYSITSFSPLGADYSYSQFDFTGTIPSNATITYSQMIMPATCCFGACATDGVSIDIYNVASFDEDTLSNAPPVYGCPLPSIGSLQETNVISGGRLTANLLSLAQWSVSNNVPAAFRLSVHPYSASFTWFCTKESVTKPFWKIQWV